MPLDVFFITSTERNAERNWIRARQIVPNIKRIEGKSSIHQAYTAAAAETSKTKCLALIDGDNYLVGACFLSFSYFPDVITVFSTRNQVNSLVYGHGGVKVLSKETLLDNNPTGADIISSLGVPLDVRPEIVSLHSFATSPFETWKTAFREAAKLYAQDSSIHNWRLAAWLNEGFGEYGNMSKLGASEGVRFASTSKDLMPLNDNAFLHSIFCISNTQ